MTKNLDINLSNLAQGKEFLSFLISNLERLVEKTEDYPVVFRCDDFTTIFVCREDIVALITMLTKKIDLVEKAA
jgi:hypothetical protein